MDTRSHPGNPWVLVAIAPWFSLATKLQRAKVVDMTAGLTGKETGNEIGRDAGNVATQRLAPSARPLRSECEEQLQELNQAIASDTPLDREREVALRVERALLLSYLGRDLEARSDHLRVLELDEGHRTNLLELGRLLVTTGQRKAAQIVYAQAVKHHPDDPVSLVNLGSATLQLDDPAGARVHYAAALAIDPELPEAHGGMYYALTRLGEFGAAALHAQKAFGRKNLFQSPYRGDGPPIPIILLVSSTGGNTPVEKLLDDTVFQTYVVVADFFDASTPLPEHQLIFNGIGDVEVATEALVAAERLIAQSSARVLNLPSAVLATSRTGNAERMARLPGVITAKTRLYPYALLAGADGVAALERDGFTFPVLLRVPGFHMGQHFVEVGSAAQLAAEVGALPGAGWPDADLLAIEYLDARGSDGCVRKYRAMFVGGQIYPLHLAISPNWKIHYFSADMADRPDHRAEEQRFLNDMAEFLGPKAMAGLEAIRDALGLDYGGIDFGIGAEGDVLLFEANATMVVEQPADDPRWDYRRSAVDRIHQGVRAMLVQHPATR
jgi:tetratricopeptide (TPR) repeat protein